MECVQGLLSVSNWLFKCQTMFDLGDMRVLVPTFRPRLTENCYVDNFAYTLYLIIGGKRCSMGSQGAKHSHCVWLYPCHLIYVTTIILTRSSLPTHQISQGVLLLWLPLARLQPAFLRRRLPTARPRPVALQWRHRGAHGPVGRHSFHTTSVSQRLQSLTTITIIAL